MEIMSRTVEESSSVEKKGASRFRTCKLFIKIVVCRMITISPRISFA